MSSVSALHSALRQATEAFLHQDYRATLIKVDNILSTLPRIKQPPWYTQLQDANIDALQELRRKVLLLLITLCASIWSSTSSDLLSELPTDSSLQTLRSSRAEKPEETRYQPLLQYSLSFYDTNAISVLPPSVVVALSLAAMKINLISQAKALIDDWEASLDAETRLLIADEGQALQESKSVENSVQSLSDRRTTSSTDSLEDSIIITNNTPLRAATLSYEKMMDVYCLAILPKRSEWQQAKDRIERATYLNGGMLSQAKCESLRTAIAKALRRKEMQEQQQKFQMAELERMSTKSSKSNSSEDSVRKSSRTTRPSTAIVKSSPRTSDSGRKSGSTTAVRKQSDSSLSGGDPSSNSSNGQSPPRTSPSKPVLSIDPSANDRLRGFAALRYALARFIAPTQPTEEDRQLSSRPTTWASIRYMLSFAVLRTTFSSILRFVLLVALVSVVLKRKARERAKKAALFWFGKLKDTVKLGTKVTQL